MTSQSHFSLMQWPIPWSVYEMILSPGIIDSQTSGGRWVLGVMLPQTVVDSNESEISWFGVPLVLAALVFRSSPDLGSFYLCRVTIMVAGSLVDHILDLEIRSVTTLA